MTIQEDPAPEPAAHDIPRTPPRPVVQTLRQEVGFLCPVQNCGNPYLTWHHFSPPWRTEHHHRTQDMIALCLEHARKADAGAFTEAQLREFKRNGARQTQAIRGRFDWMRRDLLVIVGGNFYYRQEGPILQLGDKPCIWLRRDSDGYLLTNFWLPTASREPRARLEDNWWIVPPDVAQDIESPPHGRLVHVKYPNGDELRIEFFDIESLDELDQRYPWCSTKLWSGITEPMVGVEVWERAADTDIEFGPRETRIGNYTVTRTLFTRSAGAAIAAPWPPGIGGPMYQDQELRLSDLVSHNSPVIEGGRFVRCRLIGPAVLLPLGTKFYRCGLGGPPDQVFWERTQDRRQSGGAIVAKACLFEDCTFVGVGYALTADEIEFWKKSTADAPP